MKRQMLRSGFLSVFILAAGCGTSVTSSAESPVVDESVGTRLIVDVRVFDVDGDELGCTADLSLIDTGREGGGAHELELTACHETLDANARAYGSYRFEYTVPPGGPRYLQARSLAGARLAPPEFTVQLGLKEGATAWRSLSVEYARR